MFLSVPTDAAKTLGKMPGAAGRIESAYVRALRGRGNSSSRTSRAHNNCDDILSEDGDEIQDLNDPATPAAESGRTRLFDLITLLVLFYAGVRDLCARVNQTVGTGVRPDFGFDWYRIGLNLKFKFKFKK